MKAMVMHRHGGPEVLELEDMAPPELRPGTVRLDLRAAALNRLDLFTRAGSPALRLRLPHILGCDGAGVVAEVGQGVITLSPGDRVVISPGLSCGVCQQCLSGRDNLCRRYTVLGSVEHGTYRESIVLPERNVIPMPGGLTFAECAAAPLVFLTAWHMLVGRADARPGETVLVHAAGSGVGSAAIQIASLLGCRVLTTAGSAAKADRALELGAEVCINYREQDFREEVMRLTGKAGVDVVVEHIGGEVFEKSITCLARGGRLVTCGNTAAPSSSISTAHLFFKHLSVLGSFMGSKAELIEAMKFVASGALKPVVAREFPLAQAAEAHRYLDSRQAFGKVVLAIGDQG